MRQLEAIVYSRSVAGGLVAGFLCCLVQSGSQPLSQPCSASALALMFFMFAVAETAAALRPVPGHAKPPPSQHRLDSMASRHGVEQRR